MTVVIDRDMSIEEMQEKLMELHTNRRAREEKEREFQKLVAMRRQAFGTAFLDVEDPLALQREWREE